jgi:hypothetical protein
MHPGPRTHIHADIQTYADRQVHTEFTHRAFGTVSRLFVESHAHIHTSYTPTHTGRFTRSSHFVRSARLQDLLLNYMSLTRYADFMLRRAHNDIANVCEMPVLDAFLQPLTNTHTRTQTRTRTYTQIYKPTHTGRFTRSSHFVRLARYHDLLLNHMSLTRYADFTKRRAHNDIANVCEILVNYMHFHHH